MKRCTLLTILVLIGVLFPLLSQAAPVGKFTFLEGNVDVTSPGAQARVAHLGDEVSVGDTLRTKTRSKAEVTFNDGNLLRLAEQTSMVITEYMVDQDHTSGILKLTRGKIQNIIKAAAGRIFGRDKKNRFEVHTPTAVIGVRGTNFFTYITRGVSGAAFMEGTGYGYSMNRPEEVQTINAGQAMLVVSPDKVPVIKPATDVEIQQHINDTAPGGVSQGGGGTDTLAGITKDGLLTSDHTGDLGLMPTAMQNMTAGMGPTTIGPGQNATNVVDVPISVTLPEIISRAVPVGDQFAGDLDLPLPFSPSTISGSIDPTINQGPITISGAVTAAPEGVHIGSISGLMGDGSAFEGRLGGAIGSWEGSFSSIYATPGGGTGYFYGGLSGSINAASEFTATGTAYKTGQLGTLSLAPGEGQTLHDALSASMHPLDQARVQGLPMLGSINAGGGSGSGYFQSTIDYRGLITNQGREMGIWAASTWDGTYTNQAGSTWDGAYGEKGAYSSYYITGSLHGDDDLAGHLKTSGSFTYLDALYMATMTMWNSGTYDPSTRIYQGAGAGIVTVDPLAFSAQWGGVGTIYYNNSSDTGGYYMTYAGYDQGFMGSLTAPWLNASSGFLAMGEYYVDPGLTGPYLWSSYLSGGSPSGGAVVYGKTAGFWKPGSSSYGTMAGSGVALYMDEDGSGGTLQSTDISGVLYNDLGLWAANGTWVRNPKGQVPAGYQLTSSSLWGVLDGSVGATGAISGVGWGNTEFFADQINSIGLPWGTYSLELGHITVFSDKPAGNPSWSAKMGGSGGFRTGETQSYWLADVSGAWSDQGEITGNVSGEYLSTNQMGTFSGPIYGLGNAATSGTYIGQSIGTFQGTPLSLSGETFPNLAYYDGSVFSQSGSGYGLVGGTVSIPAGVGSVPLTLMGDYSQNASVPPPPYLLYGSGVSFYGGSVAGVSPPTTGFKGHMAGIWRDGTINSRIQALYVADGYAGYLSGAASGSYYSGLLMSGAYSGMWKSSGVLLAIRMEPSTVDPANLEASLVYDQFEGSSSLMGPAGFGSFSAGGSLYANNVEGSPIRLVGHNWGVWNAGFGGAFEGTTSNAWSLAAGGSFYPGVDYNSGYWIGQILGTAWTNPDIYGTYSARALTLEGRYDFTGEVLGTHGVSGWQAAGIGTYTRTPLTFSSDLRWNIQDSAYPNYVYRLVPGTSYEVEFGVPGAGFDDIARFESEYLIAQTGQLLFGERWTEYSGSDSGQVFLPTGNYIALLESGLLAPLKRTDMGFWLPGTLGASDFITPPADDNTWEPRWYKEWQSNALAQSGDIAGIMGGTGDLWNATAASPASMDLSGRYSFIGNYWDPTIFGLEMEQSSHTTGGAYRGFLGGVFPDVEGTMYALYITDQGTAGILKGAFSGQYDPNNSMWGASGSVYPIQKASAVGIAPADLSANLNRGFIAGWLGGGTSTGPGINSDFGWGNTLSISGLDDFGVYGMVFGYGNYLAGAPSTLSAKAYGWGEFGTHVKSGGSEPDTGMWLTDPVNLSFSSGLVKAGLSGRFLTYSKYGTLAGDIIGSYDLANGTWQATSAGYWETSQKLAFNGIFEGRNGRLVEAYSGDWNNGSGGSNYHYEYRTFTNSGYSHAYDAGANTTTNVEYRPDGTKQGWTYDHGTETYSYIGGTWTGALQDLLQAPHLGDPSFVVSSLPYYYIDYESFSGLMGGLDNLWTASAAAPARMVFHGEFDQPTDSGSWPVFTASIRSHNPYDNSVTIWNQNDNTQNGAYYGFVGGIVKAGNTLDGSALALSVDRNGNVGFLKGAFTGNVDPATGTAEGQGGIYPIRIISATGYDPANLFTGGGLLYTERDVGQLNSHGAFLDFTDPANPVSFGDIHWKAFERDRAYIYSPGQTWRLGVSSALYAGSYSGTPSDYWERQFDTGTFYPDNRNVGVFVSSPETGGRWSVDGSGTGVISGKAYEGWVNWNSAVTGVSGAELKGTFDPAKGTWQAQALWAWMDTNTFLGLAATAGGRTRLTNLSIPCFEIGRTNLTQAPGTTVNNLSNVQMNDVTFFASNSNPGAAPRLWATDSVTGDFMGPVSTTGPAVSLSGGGLNASFDVTRWNTASSTWGAQVSGGGQYSGTGNMNGMDVNFSGSAAGRINGSVSGSITGTGSGKVNQIRPQ